MLKTNLLRASFGVALMALVAAVPSAFAGSATKVVGRVDSVTKSYDQSLLVHSVVVGITNLETGVVSSWSFRTESENLAQNFRVRMNRLASTQAIVEGRVDLDDRELEGVESFGQSLK
jgi:hypothetical protein